MRIVIHVICIQLTGTRHTHMHKLCQSVESDYQACWPVSQANNFNRKVLQLPQLALFFVPIYRIYLFYTSRKSLRMVTYLGLAFSLKKNNE